MRLQQILKKLTTFQTVSEDQEANIQALRWYKDQLKGLPLTIREYRYGGFPSLIITTRRTKSPKVLLQAHLDVVPGSPAAFSPTVRGRRLYGRGVYDMKFAAAVYLELLLDLQNELKHFDIGVMLTCDEEIGGRNGVRPLLFEEGYRGDVCLLPDGGEDWQFELGAKGVLLVSAISSGTSAHGARPWLGFDANKDLAAYITELTRRFNRLVTSNPDTKPYPTLSVGMMHGGNAANQVPESAEAVLDIRFPANFPRARVRKLLKESQLPKSRVVVKEIRHSGAYQNNIFDAYHETFRNVIKTIRGKEPGSVASHGSSDARHFRNLKIPVILIRPKGGGQHSEKEWIDLGDLDTYYHCVREFVQRTARRSS